MNNMPKLPSLPKLKAQVKCACGCNGLTQSRFVPGHDSKLYGAIKRVKAGVFDQEHPADATAQLDASMQWLTPGQVQALADAMGLKWSLDAANKRADAQAAKTTKAS